MNQFVAKSDNAKSAWVRPELRKIAAGAAEANPGSRDDGGLVQQS